MIRNNQAWKYSPVVCLVAVVLMHFGGCHRGDYRRKADEDAYQLIAEKANHPHWPLNDFTVDVDPRSRMFSPFSADHPPMPPDDPVSHTLMHRIDGKAGYACWHENGDTEFVENPLWLAYLPMTEQDGQKFLALDADNAVRTALMHSSEYQSQLEELYLSALDVSFERFLFDSQFFAGYALDYIADGPDRSVDNGDSSTTLAASTFPAVTMRKLGAAGSTLVVNLANQLLWEFSGANNYTGTTLLDFSLVQPLLRGAGREIVLERLTIAERALLANVRQMERYRRGFYVEVVTGQDAGQGPSRRGGFFGGSGLEGFAGVGGGGFGRVSSGVGFGGGGGTGAGQAGGFLGLLQESQNIVNQEVNVSQLRSSLAQFEALYAAGRIDFLQVLQSRQALYNAQSRLLNAKSDYEATLDGFKNTLGLPPQLKVRIDDSMIDELKLLDPEALPRQNELSQIQQRLGSTIARILDRVRLFDRWFYRQFDQHLEFDEQLQQQLAYIQEQLSLVEQVRQTTLEVNIPRAQSDLDKLREQVPDRIEKMGQLRERTQAMQRLVPRVETTSYGAAGSDIDPSVLDPQPLRNLPDTLQEQLEKIQSAIESLGPGIAELQNRINGLIAGGDDLGRDVLVERLRNDVLQPVPATLGDFSSLLLELSLLQAHARTETVSLTPIELDERTAVEIARRFRRDWMNSRAALVDAWRLIKFNADGLEGSLDVVFEGDISNFGQNPLNLQGSTGRLRAGLQFDAPLTRLDERNTYRQALIEYHQARRQYYATVDAIIRGLRAILRTIELNQLNLEVRRQAILIAIRNVELARLRLQEPPQPGQQGQQAQRPTIARDLVDALSGLQSAQNDFLSIWTTYEVLRRSLDFNLGTMQLTADGLWVEPGELTPEYLLGEIEFFHCEPPEYLMIPGMEIEGGAAPAAPEPIEPPEPISLGL